MKIGETEAVKIDAAGVYYRELNAKIKELASKGVTRFELQNIHGQRYIGTGLNKEVNIDIYGTPGNDLGAFMNGPKIIVHGNAQDGCGNTMDSGEIVVHGRAGDITSLSARGGRIYIKEDVGYRAGIHMKEYMDKKPVLVIGGTAQDFLGEYMAGGVIILLGQTLVEGQKHKARFIGTGMHGGVIYLKKDSVDSSQLGNEVGVSEVGGNELPTLERYLNEFTTHFGGKAEKILEQGFVKLSPRSVRPYGTLYAY